MTPETAHQILELPNEAISPLELDKAFYRSLRRKTGSDLKTELQMNHEKRREETESQASKEIFKEDELQKIDTTSVWDLLILEGVYLSQEELNEYEEKELCDIRRSRLWEEYSHAFKEAIEQDFPNSFLNDLLDMNPFEDMETIVSVVRNRGFVEGEMFADENIRAQIARDRFKFMYLNPTSLRIEGMHISQLNNGLYRLAFDSYVENLLVHLSKTLNCGLVDTLRLIILNSGICFDNQGNINGIPWQDFMLTEEDLLDACSRIIESLRLYSHPLEKLHTYQPGKNSMPICYIPRSLREKLTQEGGVVHEHFSSEESLFEGLLKSWQEERRSIFSEKERGAIPYVINALRALLEMDGESPGRMDISKEFLTPSREAYECLFQEPSMMVKKNDFPLKQKLTEDYRDYERIKEENKTSFSSWVSFQCDSPFEKVKSILGNFLSVTILFGLFGGPAFLIYLSVFFEVSAVDFASYFYGLVFACLAGILYAVWRCLSWPLTLSWSRALRALSPPMRKLLKLDNVLAALIAGFFGGAVGIVVFIICNPHSSPYLVLSDPSLAAAMIFGIVLFFALWLAISSNLDFVGLLKSALGKSKRKEKEKARSAWEEDIYQHITSTFPHLRVEANNRSIIKSEDSFFKYYEIDIWIPEIKLGIEANGEKYHDHRAYNRDKREGTSYSREMYKEKYCEKKGITLLHVWSSEDIGVIQRRIDAEIRKRL